MTLLMYKDCQPERQDRERQRETERNRDRQTEGEKERKRQREKFPWQLKTRGFKVGKEIEQKLSVWRNNGDIDNIPTFIILFEVL